MDSFCSIRLSLVLISSVLLRFVNGFALTTRPQITAAMATDNHNRQQVSLAMGMIQTNSWLAGSLFAEAC